MNSQDKQYFINTLSAIRIACDKALEELGVAQSTPTPRLTSKRNVPMIDHNRNFLEGTWKKPEVLKKQNKNKKATQ